MFIIIFISYTIDGVNLDWKHSLIKGVVSIILLYLAYKIIPIFTMYLISPDYIKIEHLIELIK